MITDLRKAYNAAFNQEKYAAFLNAVAVQYDYMPTFRVSETPVFIPDDFRDKLLRACDDIVRVIAQPNFKALTEGALQPQHRVPNEDAHPNFLVIDFGVCGDDADNLSPQLIELQGFPSLYFFQHDLAQHYRQHFDLPSDYTHLFGGLDEKNYIELLHKIIIGDSKPENVVLLEIEPEKQNTRIDFLATTAALGIPTICLTKVRKIGRKLYYTNDAGESIHIERIYNRVIFDELERRTDLQLDFHFTEDVDVHWVGHPNWFFRVSKYTLPFLRSEFVPKTYFLSDLGDNFPEDLENYVLKPLFSFSGQGVKINVTKQDLYNVDDPTNYILQRKVHYFPALQTPHDTAKIEIRMLMLWHPDEARPRLVNNLIRLSKGEMIGVRYNQNKDWVGASVGLFRQ
jgi:hypothetical protein